MKRFLFLTIFGATCAACMAHGDWNHDESDRISEIMATELCTGEDLPSAPIALAPTVPIAYLEPKDDIRYELKPRKRPPRVRARIPRASLRTH